MSVNWNRYLARYQQARGGIYFGGEDTYYNSQLVLTEGEKSPLLVWFGLTPPHRDDIPVIICTPERWWS